MLTEFVLSSGIILTILLLALVLKTRNKHLPHYLLIIAFLSILGFFLVLLSDIFQIEWLFQTAQLLSGSIGFLLGPLLLLFAVSISNEKIEPKSWILHFSPLIIHWLFISLPLSTIGYNNAYFSSYFTLINQHEFTLTWIETFYFWVYVIFAVKKLNKPTEVPQNQKTSMINRKLGWSIQFLYSVIFILSIDLIFASYELFLGPMEWYSGYITSITISIAFFYLCLHAYSSVFLQDLSVEILNQNQIPIAVLVSSKEMFSESEVEALTSRISYLLKEEKLYRDPDLSLGALAEKMSLSNKKLSVFINQYLGTQFYDLINTYRLEDVKEKLKSPAYSKFSIMGIAQEAGFKSKTSFYRIFKKQVGQSPLEYQKEK